MTAFVNAFVNPRTAARYEWPRNHAADGAGERGIARSIDHGATTSLGGVVRQQGADTPMQLAYSGVILDPTHHDRMVAWAATGGTQTIYFEDATGDQFEVMVTGFRSQPFAAQNSAGGTIAPRHAWNYSLEMEVVNVLAGTWNSTSLT